MIQATHQFYLKKKKVKAEVEFSWGAEDPDGDPLTYKLYIQEFGPDPIYEGSNTTFTQQLGTDIQYYWYVEAYDDQLTMTRSQDWNFRTASDWTLVNSINIPSDFSSFYVDINDEGLLIFTGSSADKDGKVVVYNSETGTELYRITTPTGERGVGIAFNSSGDQFGYLGSQYSIYKALKELKQ